MALTSKNYKATNASIWQLVSDVQAELQKPTTKIDFSGISGGAVAANALLAGVGTSVSPALTSVADKYFLEYRTKSSATSGTSRLAYLRHELGGAGGTGECLRAFTDLTAAVSGEVHGAHVSVQAGATGYSTGAATGVRGQLFIKDEAVHSGGTYYGAQSEIYSAGSTSSLAAVTKHAIHAFQATGNATGAATVKNVFAVDAISSNDTANAVSSVRLAELPASTVGIAALINGTRYFIPAVLASEWN
jgi:hypothetical protein